MTMVVVDGKLYVPEINTKPPKLPFKTLGDALAEGRKNCNMTLGVAADRAGISKSYLWSLERNESEPSLWIAATIAELYGLDLRTIAQLPRADLGNLSS